MYQAIAHFSYQNFEQDPVNLINQILEQWRFNGQILGREFGVTHHKLGEQFEFQVRLSLPEQDSLLDKYNNDWVRQAIEYAEQAGVALIFFEIVGRDYNENDTANCEPASFQLLYTSYVDSASPLYHGDVLQAIPLYRLGDQPELTEQILKWQENWQACDQLQMNGGVLEQEALAQISELESPLSQQGRALCAAIEQVSQIPTYYYLYRLGSDINLENERKCPSCHGEWKLTEPLHEIFHFKCDKCRLLSNLSWELL
ncbi:Zn-ribbon-containing protein [Bibersteinia trehalosi]|uniref:Zn-ribbon-containing protein n=1 Tax=Bibersteinia trehalosi TaxID=47735 RepID=UPI0040454E4F